MTVVEVVPPRLQRLCDDASIHPPTGVALADALESHVRWSRSEHRAILGPLLVAPEHLDELAELTRDLPPRSLWTALTVAAPTDLAPAIHRATALPAVRFAGAEVAIPDSYSVTDVVPRMEAAADDADLPELEVYVHVPPDERRDGVLDALADSDFDAALVIGIPTAGTPEDDDLASAILALVGRHLPFKATGELRRAVTGVAQDGARGHGVLNILLATDAARQTVDIDNPGVLRDHLASILACTDVDLVTRQVRDLAPARALAARASFTSFSTAAPVQAIEELVATGLVGPLAG